MRIVLLLRFRKWLLGRLGYTIAEFLCPYCTAYNVVGARQRDGTDITPCRKCKKNVGVKLQMGKFKGAISYGGDAA